MHEVPHRRSVLDWHTRTRSYPLGERTLLLGILNVTPDSFSEGGRFDSTQAALQRALELLNEGADVLDIGGESTRPGATPVSPTAEQDRVLPVIEAILKERPGSALSIDTYHAATARRALEAGVAIVNDVSGFLWDPAMAEVCADSGCGVVLTHTRGRPGEWASQSPLGKGVLACVLEGLRERIRTAQKAGIPSEKIAVDPGFGFGKRGADNFALLGSFSELRQLGLPLLAGLSRKSFLRPKGASGFEGQEAAPSAILSATIAANTAAILAGAHMIRVHDVRAARIAADIADDVLRAQS